ncbi:hypothetical protein [Streptomyces sp. NPDC093149]|uniref:hypothetical protein n=1 Tax=Streptomyces sp. NPDC093149 TaxID=3366031 RepID=UPI0037F4AF2A
MTYVDGGGLTAAGRWRREVVRRQSAELFERRIKPLEVAQRLRVSRKSAYPWHQLCGTAGSPSLVNLAVVALDRLEVLARNRLKRLQYRPETLDGFMADTGLPLGNPTSP